MLRRRCAPARRDYRESGALLSKALFDTTSKFNIYIISRVVDRASTFGGQGGCQVRSLCLPRWGRVSRKKMLYGTLLRRPPPPPPLQLILQLVMAVRIIKVGHATCGNQCYSCNGAAASFCNAGPGYCCSSSNWCGNSAAHCASGSTNCAGCRTRSGNPCSGIVLDRASNADLSERRSVNYNTGYGHNQGGCLNYSPMTQPTVL
eukprot:SAG31_NODE_12527_length_935_cov_0.994019_2_plen_204_part_00